MANTLDDAIPIIMGKIGVVLRNRARILRLINTNFSSEVAQPGEKVRVFLTSAKTTEDVTPAATPPTGQNTTLDGTDITLDQYKKSTFHLTELEAYKIANQPDYINGNMEAAVSALVDKIVDQTLANYKKIYGFVGTAGTTPFATTTQAAQDAITQLINQKVPSSNLSFILNSAAWGNALGLAAFQYVQNAGDNSVIQEAVIGRRLGFDWDYAQQIPKHTAGTITTGLIAKAATVVAVGATSVVCTTAATTGACALKTGDIITFAGHTQTYTLTADATQASASTDVTLAISPGLTTALAGSEAVTVKATHVSNLAFHRDTFALAVRPTTVGGGLMMPGGTISKVMTDSESGLSYRLDIIPQYHQTTWELKILYGYDCPRPELGVRVAG